MGKMKSFFRKKQMPEQVQKQVQEQTQKQMQKKQQEMLREAVRRDPKERRYCLLVEDMFESSRMQGVMVIGNIHGRVRLGDTMYLYQPDRPVKEVTVTTMELGPRDVVDTAKDCQIGLCLNLERVDEVSKYAVLSSVKPLTGQLAERVIENQRLFGLMMEYARLHENTAYMNALLTELCYAKFILPLYVDRPPAVDETGRMAFDENTFVGFRPLKKADDDSQLVFPAFTDELATMSWKEAFQKDQPKRFATMQLPHLLQYVNNGHAGLVVNPFGPVPVYFPKELLETVEKSEVFRKRYVRQMPVPPVAPAQEKTAESAPEA